MRYESTGCAVHLLLYHIVFCPKYRRSVLVDDVADRLRALIPEIASEYGRTIVELAVQPDHVHVFVRGLPTDQPHLTVRAVKGRTSRLLRQEFPSLRRRLPTLWTNEYLVSTQRPSPGEITAYVAQQPGS